MKNKESIIKNFGNLINENIGHGNIYNIDKALEFLTGYIAYERIKDNQDSYIRSLRQEMICNVINSDSLINLFICKIIVSQILIDSNEKDRTAILQELQAFVDETL